MKRLLLLLLVLSAPTTHAAVLHVVLDDVIHPIAEEFVGRALDEAVRVKADAVIIELRTPGGLETSMRGIVKRIIGSPVPVLVWVGPGGSRAASAGFFILESADVAAMAPGTNTGAAHPVLIGEKLDDVMKMKLQNDAAAFIRTLAQRRGRNVAAAESAVREAKSFTEDEALRAKVIDVIAPTPEVLLRWANGKTIRRFDGKSATLRITNGRVIPFQMTLKQRLLSWIMNPNVAFILMSLGMLALWAEFNHPGAILPGVVGLIAIVLAVFALNLLPTSYVAFVLIALAFGLFAAEAKFTSYGILGTGGVICLVMGAMMLVDGPIPELRVSLVTALAVSIPIGGIAVFLMTLVLRAHKNPVATGTHAMIGEIGIARTDVGGDGKVFVHGELWNARAAMDIPQGSRVRVRDVQGMHVIVEAAD